MQAWESQKKYGFDFFSSLKKLKKKRVLFFASIQKLKNMDWIFSNLKTSKIMALFFTSLIRFKKHGFNFLQTLKTHKRWIQFFLQDHNAHNTRIPFFPGLNILHNIQSNVLQNKKKCKNNFFHEKWTHYMGGKRFALVRALWARPPYNEPIFHEKIFCMFFSLQNIGLNVV